MILGKLVIKTLLLIISFKKNNMYPPLIFVKKVNGFIGVMLLTLVMTSLLPRLSDVYMIRCISVLIIICQQVTHGKKNAKEYLFNYCNMTSKRAFLQKVKVLLTSTTEKGGLC